MYCKVVSYRVVWYSNTAMMTSKKRLTSNSGVLGGHVGNNGGGGESERLVEHRLAVQHLVTVLQGGGTVTTNLFVDLNGTRKGKTVRYTRGKDTKVLFMYRRRLDLMCQREEKMAMRNLTKL